jgi:hypothetical protein
MVNYTIAPFITLDGQITVREYEDNLGSQVHPIFQTLFPKNNAVFQDESATVHKVGTVYSWFEDITALLPRNNLRVIIIINSANILTV